MRVLDTHDRFLGEADVKAITGLSRTTRWRLERAGKFPPRRVLSVNRVGWRATEIMAWLESRKPAESATTKWQQAGTVARKVVGSMVVTEDVDDE